MTTNLEKIKKKFVEQSEKIKSLDALQELKVAYLGKKGEVTLCLKELSKADPAERPALGQQINELKSFVEASVEKMQSVFDQKETAKALKDQVVDISLPGRSLPKGTLHPLTRVEDMIVSFFHSLGFSVAEGPEVETDYYNFEALNFPPDHPARDMQDTFFLENNLLLRTHTSPVQIRTMEKFAPPLRVIAPGRVYRCDMDSTHSPVFHQVEGLCVGPNINFRHFKGTIESFLRHVFGTQTQVRFRPSFFPFTEPSAEVDIMGPKGWMEIMGCGMVDPNVFESVGKSWKERTGSNPYDPEKVSGFAFGMGIERIAMLLYGISDIRMFYDNDVRFVQQFKR